MIGVINTVTIDVSDKKLVEIYSKKNDANSRRVKFLLTNNSKIIDLSETIVTIKCIKPDGTKIFNNCIVEDNSAIITLTSQMVSVAGIVDCELQVLGVDANGKSQVLTTVNFWIKVEDTVYDDGGIVSTNEYSALTAMINKGDDLYNKGQQLYEDADNLLGDVKEEMVIVESVKDEAQKASDQCNNILNGLTPRVGENGHWYVGDKDTGVMANGGITVYDDFENESTTDAASARIAHVLKEGLDTHTHNYAGAASAGGPATKAIKLETARNMNVNLASLNTQASFDGSANVTLGVIGTLGVGNGGTGNTTGMPASHASTESKYGLGTASAYGHNMVINTWTGAAVGGDGRALHAQLGYELNNRLKLVDYLTSNNTKVIYASSFTDAFTQAATIIANCRLLVIPTTGTFGNNITTLASVTYTSANQVEMDFSFCPRVCYATTNANTLSYVVYKAGTGNLKISNLRLDGTISAVNTTSFAFFHNSVDSSTIEFQNCAMALTITTGKTGASTDTPQYLKLVQSSRLIVDNCFMKLTAAVASSTSIWHVLTLEGCLTVTVRNSTITAVNSGSSAGAIAKITAINCKAGNYLALIQGTAIRGDFSATPANASDTSLVFLGNLISGSYLISGYSYKYSTVSYSNMNGTGTSYIKNFLL